MQFNAASAKSTAKSTKLAGIAAVAAVSLLARIIPEIVNALLTDTSILNYLVSVVTGSSFCKDYRFVKV